MRDGLTGGLPGGDLEPSGTTKTTKERWERLLLEERVVLHRFVTGLAGNDPHHVEDVVQETLLRAWQFADRLDWRDRPIRMWLFRVARNLLIDGWRKNHTVPVGVFAADFADLAATPDQSAQTVDRCVLVDALRSLGPAHRETVVHVHMLDRTGEDVARILGVPGGTVKSRTHHGLRLLRLHLMAHGAAA